MALLNASRPGGSSDEDSGGAVPHFGVDAAAIEAARRKQLPAWIREGMLTTRDCVLHISFR